MATKKRQPAAHGKKQAGVKKRTTKSAKKKAMSSPPTTDGQRLYPPEGGVIVRFYRIGHGDCFLLAFAGESPTDPTYVLIDCGYKPGSPGKLTTATSAAEIWDDIRAATAGHLDVAVITHEHQDHVNGITEKNLTGITIGETWMAWTEDPEDDLAKSLRTVYKDKLRGLVAARNRLAADGDQEQTDFIDTFLEFELGGNAEKFNFQAAALAVSDEQGSISGNKGSMALFKQCAHNGVKFIRPHERILPLPGTKDIRVFALGPPRNQKALEDLNPEGSEEFPDKALAIASPGNYFGAAARAVGRESSGAAVRGTLLARFQDSGQ